MLPHSPDYIVESHDLFLFIKVVLYLMSKKILFIDDNLEITLLISKFLRLKNYDVTVINDSKTGLHHILNQKYDIIILDISMPGISGFDVIDSLIKQEKIKDQKIILLTAVELSKEDIAALLELGVYSCLLKPVEMNSLIYTIEGISLPA